MLGTAMEVLLSVHRGHDYISDISRETKRAIRTIMFAVEELRKRGLVEIEQKSRKKIIKLTEKGKRVAELLEEIDRIVSGETQG